MPGRTFCRAPASSQFLTICVMHSCLVGPAAERALRSKELVIIIYEKSCCVFPLPGIVFRTRAAQSSEILPTNCGSK